MKKISVILLCFSLLLLCSCVSNEPNESITEASQADESIETSEEASENTKLLLWKQTMTNQTGSTVHTITYEYNEKGQAAVIKTVYGDSTTLLYCAYDEYGNTVEEITKDQNGKFLSHHVYEKDAEGELLNWKGLDANGNTKFENKFRYERDSLGRITATYHNDILESSIVYEEDGGYTFTGAATGSYSKYDAEGKVFESGEEGAYLTEHKYENGLLTEVKTVWEDSAMPISLVTFRYENGLQIEKTTYRDGEVTEKLLTEYNESGLVTKETTENALGIAIRIQEYEYKEFPVE